MLKEEMVRKKDEEKGKKFSRPSVKTYLRSGPWLACIWKHAESFENARGA